MTRCSNKIGSFTKISVAIIISVTIMVFLFNSLVINAATPSGERLKDIQNRVMIGTEFPSGFNVMSDASTFISTAKSEFNMVTAENAMKWDATEPNQNSFTFTEGDNLVSWAKENGMTVHGHTLVWHNQTPGWVQNLSASEMESAMYNHIDKVMEHYKGKIPVWDVVNEAFEENGSYRSSFWYNKMGNSFIEKAFIRAREVDPDVKLVYNDYNLEYTGAKSDGAYKMLKDLKSRGIPVDGVGFQMHLDIQYGFDVNDFASNMQRFADLGLEIYITEMDVRVSSNPSSSELQQQADIYEGVMQKCLAQPAVKAIQFWGFTDKYSWVPNTFSGRGAALLFDSDYKPKSAYYAVQSALNEYSSSSTSTSNTSVNPTKTAAPTTTETLKPTTTTTTTATPTTATSTVEKTASLAGNINVDYKLDSNWGNGATISIILTNKENSSVNGWNLKWKFSGNEKVTNLWNGSLTQSGNSVNVANTSYNALIPANGSVSFGFNLSYSGTTSSPTEFSLN